jgi:hypothetical protein
MIASTEQCKSAGWGGHGTRKEDTSNDIQNFDEETLKLSVCKTEKCVADNIKIDVTKKECVGGEWMKTDDKRVQRLALALAVLNFRV